MLARVYLSNDVGSSPLISNRLLKTELEVSSRPRAVALVVVFTPSDTRDSEGKPSSSAALDRVVQEGLEHE